MTMQKYLRLQFYQRDAGRVGESHQAGRRSSSLNAARLLLHPALVYDFFLRHEFSGTWHPTEHLALVRGFCACMIFALALTLFFPHKVSSWFTGVAFWLSSRVSSLWVHDPDHSRRRKDRCIHVTRSVIHP